MLKDTWSYLSTADEKKNNPPPRSLVAYSETHNLMQ